MEPAATARIEIQQVRRAARAIANGDSAQGLAMATEKEETGHGETRRRGNSGGLAAGSARATAGFSMIEALIAAAILLIIALGLLPLFSRSISDNVSGNDASQATNGSRTEVEEMLQLPFNNHAARGPGRLRASSDQGLLDARATPSRTGEQRRGVVGRPRRPWHGAVEPHDATCASTASATSPTASSTLPLDGGTQPTFVQLKQIEVVVDNPKKNLFGNGQGITLTRPQALLRAERDHDQRH